MLVYLGIDWSEQKHDLSFQNELGAEILHLRIPHSENGFLTLNQSVANLGASPAECMVGLETAHNLLIDFLWAHGYTQIYVLPPNLVKSNQGRHRQSGAKDDRCDAALIAELVRTDRSHLYPWRPGSLLLQQMRAKVSYLYFLTRDIVQHTNRLRSILLRYYPAATQVFSALDTKICLDFIQAFPTPQQAAQLDFETFSAFARSHHYPQPKRLLLNYARLQQPQPIPAAETVQAFQDEAVQLCQLVKMLVQRKEETLQELDRLYQQHPDHVIFASLPGLGARLAPAMLVKFGEDRQRFPQPELVQALAGTCPITVQSGKSKYVRFRQSCDHEFRHYVQQWAWHSLQHSSWAEAYYLRVRPNCRSDSHVLRCLANRWLAIAWKLWVSETPYDETYHLRQHALRLRPRA